MKGLKKLLTGVLAATMIMSASISVCAAETVTKADGVTGAATITVKNTHANETYKIYKVFDATTDGTNISYKLVAGKTEAPAGFEVDTAGNVLYTENTNLKEGEKPETALSAEDIAAIKAYVANDTPVATVVEDADGSFTVDGLPYGYYFIQTTTGAIVTVDSTNPDAEVADKNGTTTTDKKVEEDSTGNFGDKDDADIGQTVNFKSTITVQPGVTGLKFEDEMTESLDLVKGSVKVDTLTEGQYTVNYVENDNQHFNITFKDEAIGALAKDTVITITYSAVLNKNAIVGIPEGKEFKAGNDNRSRIQYDNHTDLEWDWTRTYTYKLDVVKNDGNGTKLAGAEFELSLNKEKADSIPVVDLGNGKYRVATAEEIAAEKSTTTLVTPSDEERKGLIEITGLDADQYKLTETKAPEGYNILTAPITFTITSKTTSEQGDSNDQQAVNSVEYTRDGKTFTELEVVNTAGSILPSTGGMGTTIFYVLGVVLIVAGAAYFIVRRKQNAE